MTTVLTSNQQAGGAQFQAALQRSQNTINMLLRQAGVAGDTSGYNAERMLSGEATDPANLAKLSYGPEGAFSEAYQAGGNVAAEQAAMSRSSGLAGGGLAAQRQELALMQTQQGAGDVSRALIGGIGEQYQAAQQADADEIIRLAGVSTGVADTAAAGGSVTNPEASAPVAPVAPVAAPTAAESTPPNTAGPNIPPSERAAYTKKGNPGGKEPKNPAPGDTFKGAGGLFWVYRSHGPGGPGWYKK